MMSYVTTNIRIAEEDYLRLKGEAAKKRKSLSAVIREKVSAKKVVSQNEAKKFIDRIRKHAAQNAKYLQGADGVKIIRDIRDNAKW